MHVELLTLVGWSVPAVALLAGGVAVVVVRRRKRRRPVRRAAELGVTALRERRFDEAIQYLNVALRFAPDAVSLYLRRAEAWHGLGKPRRAVADCDRAVGLAKYTAEPYRVRGQIHAVEGKVEQAVSDLLRAAELDAADTESLVFAAGLLLDAGQTERAFATAGQAVERNPGHAEGYYVRGRVLEQLGRFDAAFGEYTSALQLDPFRPDLPERLKRCTVAGGRVPPEPPVVVPEPPPPRPRTVPQLLRSSAEHLAKGNADAALADLTAALALDPDNTAALMQRGWLWVDRGDYSRGLTDFDRAGARADNPDALYGCGRCLQLSGQWAAAVEDFDRILATNPNIAPVRFHRGQCLVQLEAYAAAVADLRAAVALDPKGVEFKHQFARLLATCPADEWRDGPRAVELAEAVVRQADTGEHRATLASALAEVGDFAAAVEQAEAALRDARLSADVRAAVADEREEFRAGRAVRIGASAGEPAGVR